MEEVGREEEARPAAAHGGERRDGRGRDSGETLEQQIVRERRDRRDGGRRIRVVDRDERFGVGGIG